MIDTTEMLRAYLRGIRSLSAASAATLWVPASHAASTPPLLLHDGHPPPAELADEEAARRLVSETAGEASPLEPVAGREPGTLLLPLPADPQGPGAPDSETPQRRRTDRAGDEPPPLGAWLGLRLPEGSRLPPPAGAETADLWRWLASFGGLLAAHTAGVAAILRDPMTGLPDRVGLHALLSDALADATENRPVSLVLINPDGFETVNQRIGRAGADATIREIATRLRGSLRTSDPVARYGGVVFAVILVNTPSEAGRRVAENTLARLSASRFLDHRVELRFSAGMATSNGEPEGEPLVLVRRADRALRAAKSAGGGHICEWNAGLGLDNGPSFDRLSGIFTGDMTRDYRNMLALSDTVSALAQHHDFDGLAAEVVERLYETFGPDRVALYGLADGDRTLVRGLTRRDREASAQRRLETIELESAQEKLVRSALVSGEAVALTWSAPEGERRAFALPLTAGQRAFGCLYIDGEVDSFHFALLGLPFLRALGSQLGVALDRARLLEGERRREEQEKKRLRAELNELRRALRQAKMVYRSSRIEELMTTVRRIAPTEVTVLITGESGTGKELLARTIHEMSPRRDRPMVVVDCGAIATSLMESELFGHERGAYTGAQTRRTGRLAEADGGTLLLDEVGELPLEVQSKLLRFVQEKQFVTVGGSRPRRVDVRILAATNRDLGADVEAGRFREDLFHRLNVVRLEVPPLRERPDDVIHLARHFVELYSVQYQKGALRLTDEAEEALAHYPWPGNVRELQNRLMQAVILSDGRTIGVEELNLRAGLGGESPRVSTAWKAPLGTTGSVAELASRRPAEAVLERLRAALARQIRAAVAAGAPAGYPIGRWLAQDLVLAADDASGGVARQAAAVLGIPDTTFRRRLRKARQQAAAGFSLRSDQWAEVRELLDQLVRARFTGRCLLDAAEQLLIGEILEQLPGETRAGSYLLGVTPPTFRSRVEALTGGR